MDFANACCRTGHSRQIPEYIKYFKIIFQIIKSTKYARKMMHIVACLKKLQKKQIKETWLEFCLINIFIQPSKFLSNDMFSKTIIVLNKENINLSANTKSDKFFCKTVS